MGGGEGGDRKKRTPLERCPPRVGRIRGHSPAAGRDGGEDGTRRHVQEHHAAGLRHGAYHTGDMVRDRVGDWRIAWRFALAGVIAGILVISLAQTGVTNGTFDRGQDQLFPAAAPDPRITYVEVDSRTQRDLGAYPFNNGYDAQVINYLASLRPRVILFDIVLDHITGKDIETGTDTDARLTNAIGKAGNVVLVCTAETAPRPEFSTVAAAVRDRGLGVADPANAVRW